MKLNPIVYKPCFIAFMAVLASALLTLTGCRDDAESLSFNLSDGTVLEIRIPVTENIYASRAEGETAPKTGEEGKINKLWLLAFPNESGEKKIIDLSSASYRSEGNYRVYNVNIKAGTYNFYLFANLDRYLSSEDNAKLAPNGSIEEERIPEIELNFEGENRQLVQNYLPMAAFPNKSDIDEANETTGRVTIIAEKTNRVNFNLRFLCAKVRHTILFDNSSNGISKEFHNNIIEYIIPDKVAQAENICKSTNLKFIAQRAKGIDDNLAWPLVINKYKFPDNPNYPLDSGDQLYAWVDDAEVTWNTAGKKAWQYVTYLPENLTETKTVLSHPYLISGVAGSKPHVYTLQELNRAQMYDIVTKVINSDFKDENTTLTISDWDLKNIQYELHGPYELIVENTDVEIVSTVRWTTMGFQTDVPENAIGFEYPKVNINGKEVDFYYAEVINPTMTDEDGKKYDFEDDWQKHLRIRINPEIPYSVIKSLKELKENETWKDGAGNNFDQKSLSYFHLITGNLHKRIDVKLLELEVALTVTPLTIIIDTREYYTNGWSDKTGDEGIKISFSTNYSEEDLESRFTLSDSNDLFTGKGEKENGDYVLKLEDAGFKSGGNNQYKINVSKGELTLDITDILEGHSFWTKDNEFTLTFSLKYDDDGSSTLEKKVRIIVKPFSSNYIIHFKSNTGWNNPVHIFVYQDLLLPSDLTSGKNNEGTEIDADAYAGKIVGFVEWNENKQQYNAATEYVFSNNISFRGWAEYGGPNINNPYDIYPDYINNDGYPRQGFVMLGKPNGEAGSTTWVWNEGYGYTNRAPNERFQRYRYDVNFNEDHENRIINSSNGWQCNNCHNKYNAGSKYNSKYSGWTDHDYDYPGIVMEKEDDGWWRYTLTGVAQPGKTMIIFAESEEPWNLGDQDDHRFPAAYETGLPLFDFEDNEGWFVFNGKNTPGKTDVTDPHFTDDKPEN